MKTYSVTVVKKISLFATMTVEAEDETHAEELAEEEMDSTHFHKEETVAIEVENPTKPPVQAEPTPFEKYQRTRGNRCPLCQGQHITAHPFNADDLEAWRDVECLECEETWREMFTMQNIDIV